jgi:hypothetical protein
MKAKLRKRWSRKLIFAWVKRTNSWCFILGDEIWALPDVRDVTADLQQAEQSWGRPGMLCGPRIGAVAP